MIRLTREVRCSIVPGGQIASADGSNGWAGWPRPLGIAPFVVFRLSLRGEPNPVTGYLCDIKVMDNLVREHALPVLENNPDLGMGLLAIKVWKQLREAVPAGTELDSIELALTPYLRLSVSKESPTMVRLTEQFEFAAAHRLHCPELSDEENKQIFGKCNNPNGHGHNYLVDVTIEGTPDATTGTLLPLGELERRVKDQVIHRFDHKHLNIDTEEFKELNPSVENIARAVWNRLVDEVAPARLARVRVYETAKTWVDYEGA